MRRYVGAAMVAAVFAAGTIGASASALNDPASGCNDRVVYRYCGDRIRLDRPIRFVVNHAGRPSNIEKADVTVAATAAALEWNRHWPLGVRADGCFAVCYEKDGSTAFGANGVSTISWGDVGQCDGADADGVAVACLYFDDQKRIKEVDIVLNSTKRWSQPIVDPAGEIFGALPLGSDWYDLQSVLTHEFGHAIGLDDIGAARPWPHDLTDSARYQQTMYRFYYRNSTNKRTLAEGDIAGLQEVAIRAALNK